MSAESGSESAFSGASLASPGPEPTAGGHRALLRLAAGLPAQAQTLEQALGLAVPEICVALGWPVGYACVSPLGDAKAEADSVIWHSGERRFDTLQTEILAAARSKGSRPTNRRTEAAVSIERITGDHSDPVARVGAAAGLRSSVSLTVTAEGRAAAVVQLFSVAEPRDDNNLKSLLGLLASQLSLIAGRERMRSAVRRAARHARAQATELAQLRATTEIGLFDVHTGLPREALVEDRVRQAIRRRQRSPKNLFAVFALHVGPADPSSDDEQEAGDRRVTVARRLSNHLRPSDTVGHGRDETFLCALEGIRSLDEASHVAERMRREVARPLSVGSDEEGLRVHVGVVLGGTAYDEPRALLHDAYLALNRATRHGQGVELFDLASRESQEKRRWLQAELGKALQNRDLFIEYQPIVSLQDGRITGLEALVRWRHAELGLVSPAEFVPVAEESPLILDIGNWVLGEVCLQIRRWLDHLAPRNPPAVAVNVTARQLYHEEFLDRVRGILERNAIQGSQVRFDISEQDLMRDASRAAELLDRLQGMGIRVAVDDFGTGYSSLSLLHELPVSALKIDRSFVSRPREKLRGWGVARTIIELARALDVDVIAEGIETREQFLHLRNVGCLEAQGFLFSGPVSPAKVEALIRDGYPLDLESR